MRIVLSLLMSFLLLQSQVYAFHGGLIDNQALGGSNAEGSYVGTMRGENLIGVTIFGFSNSQESNGRYAVFHDGVSFIGKAIAAIDTHTKVVSAVFIGSRSITLTQTTTTIPFDVNGDGVIGPGEVLTFISASNVVINADGAFRGKLQTQAPSFHFSASGTFGFFTAVDNANKPIVEEVEIFISGLRTSTSLPSFVTTVSGDTAGSGG